MLGNWLWDDGNLGLTSPNVILTYRNKIQGFSWNEWIVCPFSNAVFWQLGFWWKLVSIQNEAAFFGKEPKLMCAASLIKSRSISLEIYWGGGWWWGKRRTLAWNSVAKMRKCNQLSCLNRLPSQSLSSSKTNKQIFFKNKVFKKKAHPSFPPFSIVFFLWRRKDCFLSGRKVAVLTSDPGFPPPRASDSWNHF